MLGYAAWICPCSACHGPCTSFALVRHKLNAHLSAAVAAFAAEVDAMAEYAVARWAASAAARDDRPATSARSLCHTG
jgi:hypothetical protein